MCMVQDAVALIICILSVLIGEAVQCYENDHRLANMSSYYTSNNTRYDIGTLEVCINGTYYPSCLDSLPDNICSNIYSYNSSKVVGFACSSWWKWCYMYGSLAGWQIKGSAAKACCCGTCSSQVCNGLVQKTTVYQDGSVQQFTHFFTL